MAIYEVTFRDLRYGENSIKGRKRFNLIRAKNLSRAKKLFKIKFDSLKYFKTKFRKVKLSKYYDLPKKEGVY
ncbi:MAG: hypothetical protein ACOCV1_00100 [Bacillota bacterium]